MMSGIRVEGLEKAVKQIEAITKDIAFKTLRGLIKAGLHIQGESQRITPIDTGNLRASAFTVWSGKGAVPPGKQFSNRNKMAGRMSADHTSVVNEERSRLGDKVLFPGVTVGYTAFYALFVHEGEQSHWKVVMPRGKRKDAVKVTDLLKQVGENKFLEKAILRNLATIERLVREEVTK